MTYGCNRLQDIDQWRESRVFPDELRAHVEGCPTCRRYLAQWPAIDDNLKAAFALNDDESELSRQQTARALIERARGVRQPSAGFRWRHPVPVAALLLLMVAGIVFLTSHFTPTPEGSKSGADAVNVAALPVTMHRIRGETVEKDNIASERPRISVAPDERRVLHIGNDQVGIDANGRVTLERAVIDEVSLKLEQGKIACNVEHRKTGERFVVKSGNVRVQVVGTRFSVVRNAADVIVSVTEGIVEVSEKKNVWQVTAGMQLVVDTHGNATRGSLDSAENRDITHLLNTRPQKSSRPPIEPAPIATADEPQIREHPAESQHPVPSATQRTEVPLRLWQEWILDGHYDDARIALKAHVRTRPRDRQAWALLADCERKDGRWEEAVSAYRRVMKLSPAGPGRRAAFRAAAILQDNLADHSSAIELLEAYVATASPADALAAEARIRLARSCLKVGKTHRARALLEDVIANYPGTPVANRADTMLRQLP
jgi:TolA-binding protein